MLRYAHPKGAAKVAAMAGRALSRERAMLVLSRKRGEKVVINGDIVVTIVRIDRNQVRLGIEAPDTVPIYREEVLKRRDQENNGSEPELDPQG